MVKPIDQRSIAEVITKRFSGSRLKLTRDQIDALAVAVERVAETRFRVSENLGDLRQATFTASPKGTMKIDPRNNPREGKRGKVATVNPQSVEIIGYLALEWVDVTGCEIPTRIVDHYADPFFRFVEAIHPSIDWRRKDNELKLEPREGPDRRPKTRQKLASIPTAKEMIRHWLRFREHTAAN